MRHSLILQTYCPLEKIRLTLAKSLLKAYTLVNLPHRVTQPPIETLPFFRNRFVSRLTVVQTILHLRIPSTLVAEEPEKKFGTHLRNSGKSWSQMPIEELNQRSKS